MSGRHSRQGFSLTELYAEPKREPFPRVRAPGQTLPVLGSSACWCSLPHNHGWDGKEQDAPHPSPFREMENLVQEYVRRVNEATEQAIGQAVETAQALGWGVLVLVQDGVPSKCGPSPEVPKGEIHWRSSR